MSRIHEALKKAEQDRALGLGSEPQVDPIGVAERKSVAAIAIEPSPLAPPSSPASPAALKFDELCARCVHPKWAPDPRVNVFVTPTPSAQAAEQFRTLRSRLYQLRGTQPLQKILVTSSVPGEGKTFVT